MTDPCPDCAAEKAFIEAFSMVTESGLPMEEYVPMDYPRSDVVYVRLPTASALPADVHLPPLPLVSGAYVAGGFAADLLLNRGQGEARDVDVFFKSREAFEEMFDRLTSLGYVLDNQCYRFIDPATKKLVWTEEFEKKVPYVEFQPPLDQRWMEGSKPLQLVKIRWYDSAEHVIDSFDFTVVQVAFDIGAQECFFGPLTPLHFDQRLIVQHRVESRTRVDMRIAKYEDKGFERTKDFVLPEKVKVEVHDLKPVETW